VATNPVKIEFKNTKRNQSKSNAEEHSSKDYCKVQYLVLNYFYKYYVDFKRIKKYGTATASVR
jgi:hypothetical protein